MKFYTCMIWNYPRNIIVNWSIFSVFRYSKTCSTRHTEIQWLQILQNIHCETCKVVLIFYSNLLTYHAMAFNHDIQKMFQWAKICSGLWKRQVWYANDKTGSHFVKLESKNHRGVHRVLISATTSALSSTANVDTLCRLRGVSRNIDKPTSRNIFSNG